MDNSLGDSWLDLSDFRSRDVNSNDPKQPSNDNFMETMVSSRYGDAKLIQIGLSELATSTSTKTFEGVKHVIFLLPGNPGIVNFYTNMMKKLYKKVKIPIIGLSHPGLWKDGAHSVVEPITCRMQVLHKLDFIEEYIPSDVKLILMGHSIGGFFCLEIMKGIVDRDRIVHSVLLMPALNDLRHSIGGKIFAVVDFFSWLFYMFIFAVSCLPETIMLRGFRTLLSLTMDDIDEETLKLSSELRSVKLGQNCLALGRDEMKQVAQRDDLFIRRNLNKLSFIYAEKDEWIPNRLVSDLEKDFPYADINTLKGTVHTFILDNKMTDDVIQVIASKLRPFVLNKPATE